MAGEPRVPAPHPGDAAAEVLKSATLDLTRSLELDSIFESLLQHLRRLVPYDTANVMLLENDSRITVRALSGYEQWSDPDLTRGATFDVATHPIFGTLIATRRSILIPDTSVHPGWQRHEGADHVRNWMGVPLLAADRVIGLYAVDKAEPGFFTSEHLRFTEALAPHAALAIRNARLYEQIQRSEERFRALVDNSNEVVSLLDRHGVTLYSSQSSVAILGDSVEDLVGQTPFERVHPDDRAEVQALFESCLRSPGFPLVSEFRMRHRSGSWRTVEAVLVNRLDDPSVAAAVLNYRDVTDRKRSQQKIEDLNRDLQRQVAEFETLLEVIPIGIGIARDPACRRIEGNPYMTRLMGGTPRENISFSAPTGEARPTTTRIYRDGQPLAPEELPMQRAAAQGAEVVDMEMDVVRDGEKVATILGYAAPLFDESGRPRGAIGASLDITERKRAEEQIKGLAYLDALTGLPNRRLFQDRLSVAIAQAHRNGQGLAVLYLDLDRFKPVNDSLGHAAGDRLIQDVAERLRTCLREGDTVARLGGDEFSMLLPGVSQVVDAARVAEKVLDTFRRPFQLEGREIFATASIGISLYPEDGADVESLVKNADAAMYRAKQQGRDNYQLYAPALNATALERLALESHLRHALSKDQLVVHYQPVVEHATGRVHAMEALLRWRHPDLGLVPPGDFIPLAEVTGQIIAFGPWVLRAACAQTREWHEAGHSDLGVAVNLSARQFQHPDLVAQVRRALDETKLDPSFLELEITESSAMHGEAAVQTMRELKALGVRIAIDDFGTGYSSLSYLRRFPIDTLKIDRSFIADITRDPDDAAIATAVIALAHTLKLRVVAEGVETDEQVAFLSARRCDLVQGYLFGAPRPAEDSGGLLEAPLGVRAIRA